VSRLNAGASAALKLALAGAVGAAAWWLVVTTPGASKPDKPPAPATVGKVVKEDDLNTVSLTEDAEKRIGLTVGAVEKKAVRRVRVYGGEVTVPVGRAIPVAAPLGGTLKGPAGGELKAGQVVRAGQVVFELIPLLTPDGRATLAAALADATGQANTAKAAFELADIAVKRAERVLKDGAGSQRQVDEARAAFDVAKRTLDAATARQTILNKVVGDADGGTATPLPITAPQDGILRVVSARPGQPVPLGAALFEVADLSVVWVRVPLPVGDLDAVAPAEPAQVGKLSAPPGAPLVTARPVQAPPSANPLAATVDVYYELPNGDGKLIPGQRLGATLALAGPVDGATVPWAAVVFDVHGGAWVYERVGARQYARRRVVVSHTVGADAALASGPAVGAPVVTAGAQQLFGVETGFVK
jgi:RND family efflux transporter MFP subunit